MAWSLTVKTPPTELPITLVEAKAHLRVDLSEENDLIESLIGAATQTLEWRYDRALMTQTLVLGLDRFVQPGTALPGVGAPGVSVAGWGPGGTQWGFYTPTWSAIELRPPVQSITSITYLDPTGATQTMDPAKYLLDASEPARVFPGVNQIWPVPAYLPGSVKIEFVAGYTSAGLVPEPQKSAIKLILTDLYEQRGQSVIEERVSAALQVPFGVDELMAPWKPILVR